MYINHKYLVLLTTGKISKEYHLLVQHLVCLHRYVADLNAEMNHIV